MCHLQDLHKCICWLHVFVVTGWGFFCECTGTSSSQLEENTLNQILGQCSGPPSSDPFSSCLLFICELAAILCQLWQKRRRKKKKKIPLLAMSRRHSLLVHTAAESFDVITDVSDHTVPFVSLRGLLALVWCGAPSGCSVAVGGRIGGGAGCAPVAAKAVSDDASSVLHTDGLEEILKVLAVLLWYEGTQTWQGTDWCLSAWQQSFQHVLRTNAFVLHYMWCEMKVDLYIIKETAEQLGLHILFFISHVYM